MRQLPRDCRASVARPDSGFVSGIGLRGIRKAFSIRVALPSPDRQRRNGEGDGKRTTIVRRLRRRFRLLKCREKKKSRQPDLERGETGGNGFALHPDMPGGKEERGGKEGGFQKSGTVVKRILTFPKSTLAPLISRKQYIL